MWYTRHMRDKEKLQRAQHEHYLNNKEKYKISMAASRQARLDFVFTIKKSTPCTDCFNYFHPCIMDFDHRDRSQKINKISQIVRSAGMKRLQQEIDKCDVVCANCHRMRTFLRIKEDENWGFS